MSTVKSTTFLLLVPAWDTNCVCCLACVYEVCHSRPAVHLHFRYSKQGWPGSMYGVSKLCEATYTRVLAQQFKERGVAAYACCPG